MKCKACKDRPLTAAAELGSEVNLIFLFGSPTQIYSVKMAHASGLLGDSIDGEPFGETWVAAAEITAEDFYKLRAQKNVMALVETCKTACSKHEVSIVLELGAIIAMMTDAGKYGMFLVKEITPTSIRIDACHILL